MAGRKFRVRKKHGLKGGQCRLLGQLCLVKAFNESRRRPVNRRCNELISGRKVAKDRSMANASFTGYRFGGDRSGIVRSRESNKSSDQRFSAFGRTQTFGFWAGSHAK